MVFAAAVLAQCSPWRTPLVYWIFHRRSIADGLIASATAASKREKNVGSSLREMLMAKAVEVQKRWCLPHPFLWICLDRVSLSEWVYSAMQQLPHIVQVLVLQHAWWPCNGQSLDDGILLVMIATIHVEEQVAVLISLGCARVQNLLPNKKWSGNWVQMWACWAGAVQKCLSWHMDG